MQAQESAFLRDLWTQFAAFLPALVGGLLMIAAGWAAGWLVKRTLVRLLVWLRLDRLAGRAGWRTAFGKGDVRSALYNLVGNIAMLVVVLVFVDDALNRWGLTALSRIIDNLVFYLPNLFLVVLILAIGLVLSNGLGQRVTAALAEEGVAQARLVGKLVKGALLAVVLALALWQLQFAREIVLAGFLISFGSIGIAFALGVGLGAARAVEHGLSDLWRKKKEEE